MTALAGRVSETSPSTDPSPRSLKHHQGTVDHPRDTRVKRTLYAIAGIGSALIFGVPLLIAIMRAFQPNAVITAAPTWATFWNFGFENFQAIFSPSSHLLTGLVNSLIVAISTAVITAVVATMAGYGFSKFRFRGSKAVFGLVLLTMMVPFQAILTPLYLQLNAMHLTNSLAGLVLFYVTVNLPFGTFVMRNAFDAIPDELEDSALVDGASRTRVIVTVLRPLLLPGSGHRGPLRFSGGVDRVPGRLDLPDEGLALHAAGRPAQSADGHVRPGQLRHSRRRLRDRDDPVHRALRRSAAVLRGGPVVGCAERVALRRAVK